MRAAGLSPRPPAPTAGPAVYGIRPEHFVIADDGAEAEVQVVEPTGSETQVIAKLGGKEIIAVFRERHQFKPGDKIRLKPDPRLVHLFDEATGKTTDCTENQNQGRRMKMTDFTRRSMCRAVPHLARLAR